MTREEFISILKRKRYSYLEKGNKIVVTGGNKHEDCIFPSLETLPSGVKFKNNGGVSLNSLKTIPSGVVFDNNGNVDLNSLETISPDTIFGNRIWYVHLESLKTLPLGVKFKINGGVELDSLETLPSGFIFNGGDVDLPSLKSIPRDVVFDISNSSTVFLPSLMKERKRTILAISSFAFDDWSGNIEGIGSNRLLNKMISDGLFDRR